jgi:aarF domain-containing kinase
MTEVTEDQRYCMIEAIAHLINRDYENIGDDFVNMDFIPRGVDTKPIVPALARVFDAALAGGGAKSINFQDLASDLAQITYKFPFRIPPYAALIIRAVSVLEGIALVGNPQFAIIDEAYPYLSRRLLTDDSERMREALRYMVYGSSGVFDVDRMIDLLQALEKFVAVRDTGDGTAFKVDGVRAGKYVGQAGDSRGTRQLQEADGAVARSALDSYRAEVQQQPGDNNGMWATVESAPQLSLAATSEEGTTSDSAEKAREALQFFFSKEGDIFRTFLLDEIVVAADALSRDALTQLTAMPAAQILDSVPSPAGLREINRALFKALSPPLTEYDQKVLGSIRKLIDFFLGNLEITAEEDSTASTSKTSPDSGALEQARSLLPVLQENREEMRAFGLQIVSRLAELQASRAIGFLRDRIVPSPRSTT